MPIVDADIEYDDKYSGETYLLVFHDALVMPSMDHNLVSQFTLSEAVLEVDTIPKQNKRSPSIEQHIVHFKEVETRMHLQLHGVFSCFLS